MYTLFTEPSLAYGWGSMQNADTNGYNNYAILFLFDGTPPTSADDIPLALQKSPVELAKTSVAFNQIYGTHTVTGNETSEFDYTHYAAHMAVKGVKYFDELGRYVYNHSVGTLARTHRGPENMTEEGESAQESTYFGTSYQDEASFLYMRELQDIYNINGYRYREERLLKNTYSKSSGLSRYAYRYPLVYIFDQEVPVDSMWIGQGSASGNYTPTTATIDRWDSATSQWVQVDTLDDTQLINGRNAVCLIDFAETFTTSKIRITFGDTGNTNPYWRHMHFCSKVDPGIQQTPVDITWGVIMFSGANQSDSSFDTYPNLYQYDVNTDEETVRKDGYPLMILDVGEPGSDAAVIVNRADQVMPFEDINLINFNIKFEGDSE